MEMSAPFLSGGVTQSCSHIRSLLKIGIKVFFVSHWEDVAASSKTGKANKKGVGGVPWNPSKIPPNICFITFQWIPFKVLCLTAQSISVLLSLK